MKIVIPKLYKHKKECSGCTACYAVCANEAIVMIPDEEGFEYPEVDALKCVGCGCCLKVCPNKIDLDTFYD